MSYTISAETMWSFDKLTGDLYIEFPAHTLIQAIDNSVVDDFVFFERHLEISTDW